MTMHTFLAGALLVPSLFIGGVAADAALETGIFFEPKEVAFESATEGFIDITSGEEGGAYGSGLNTGSSGTVETNVQETEVETDTETEMETETQVDVEVEAEVEVEEEEEEEVRVGGHTVRVDANTHAQVRNVAHRYDVLQIVSE